MVKDVFDTELIERVARELREAEYRSIDISPADLAKVLDVLGRFLFTIDHRRSAFLAKLGNEDLALLETTIRELLEGVGDYAVWRKVHDAQGETCGMPKVL